MGRSVSFRGILPSLPDISIRGDEVRPAASVAKIPLIMAIYRLARERKIDLDMRVSVEAFSSTRYVSILAAFDPERDLSLREICRLALITSDNPLAVFLQKLVDFDDVNRLLQQAGCGPSCRISVGFSEDELGAKNRVNAMTANATLNLMSALRSDPAYHDVMTGLKNNLRNNRIPALLPDQVDVFHKTGSLNGVANDVGILKDDKVEFVLAFYTDAQSDTLKTSNDIAVCAANIYERLAAAS